MFFAIGSMAKRPHFQFHRLTSLTVSLLAGLSAPFYGLVSDSDPQIGNANAADARSRPPALAPDTVNMIYALSAHPELMNLSYLRYVIGNPENERSQLAMKAKTYYWYQEPQRIVTYSLHQDGPRPGTVTRSIFTISVPDSQLSTKEMERLFGQEHKRVFDHNSHPTDVYSFGPNTYVAFAQPQDTFRVNKIHVGYEGPPLPPPPEQAVYAAYSLGKNKAVEAAMKSGNWREAITWLRRDAAMRPSDPFVHIQLGQAYRAGLMLNEAIAEYSTAARYGAGNPEVDKICRAALVDMKVLPPHAQRHQSDPRSFVAGNSLSRAAGL